MTIAFTPFFERLNTATDIRSQTDLATALGVNRSAVTQAKTRNAVPQKWILSLARRYELSADWLEFGKGAPRSAAPKTRQIAPPPPPPLARVLHPLALNGLDAPPSLEDEELVYVPKASARLCAGAGSFEVEARALAEYPMPYRRLAALGSPKAMIFMDVVGDSMEPGIRNGDTVLVDQSRTAAADNAVYAVGVEDAIYLKRIVADAQGLILRSDNEDYADICLYGDELHSFRVIGKVVWLCRDCRKL